MKGVVIFVCLLVISMPFSLAKEVVILDSFEVQEKIPISNERDVYYYAGSQLISVNGEYKYQERLGSSVNSKSLPFGQKISNEERLSFTGKELDEDLYYFNARYYDPNLGKFTSVDPVRDNHPYSYVANNPMNLVDPDGKQEAIVNNRLYFSLEYVPKGDNVNVLSRGEFFLRGGNIWATRMNSGAAPYRSIGGATQNTLFLSTHGSPGTLQGISVPRSILAVRGNPNINYVGVSACHSTQTAAMFNLFTGRTSMGYMGGLRLFPSETTSHLGYLSSGGNTVFRTPVTYGRGMLNTGMVFSNRGTSASYLGLSGLAAAASVVGLAYFAYDSVEAIQEAETAEEKAIEITARASGLAAASQTAPVGAAIGAELGTPLGPLGFLGGGFLGGLVGGGIGYFGGEITGEVAGMGAMEQGRREAEAASSGDINDIIGFADWGGP